MRRLIFGFLLLGLAGFSLLIIPDRRQRVVALGQTSSPQSCGAA